MNSRAEVFQDIGRGKKIFTQHGEISAGLVDA